MRVMGTLLEMVDFFYDFKFNFPMIFQVYIFTHVPIGNKAIRSPYDVTFVDIINEYGSIIKSMHAAHEHLDRFRLIYKDGVG